MRASWEQGLARPKLITSDLAAAVDGGRRHPGLPADIRARRCRTRLASAGAKAPVVLNPGHTGGALEFRQTFRALGVEPPPIAEFSTLTYVARKHTPGRVTITGSAKSVRLAALPRRYGGA